MKLFLFTVEIRDGEHEYSYQNLVRARNMNSAEKKAKRYTKTFLCSRMRWVDDNRLEPEGSDGEYRILKFSGIGEITEELFIQRFLIN